MSGPLSRWFFPVLLLAGIGLPISQADHGARHTPLVRAVQQCRKSVVNLHTERTDAADTDSRFFSQKPRKVTGMGTGIVVDERGYIVTNYHVIQDVDLITVTLHDGSIHIARPVSFDRKHDLAIIRIDTDKPLVVMPMGTSCDLMLAETVFAVGNAFGYEGTVTSGIVSAISRDVEVDETQSYENLIQTDASINPGNSGGPLLNLEGEVIGINVAIHGKAQRIGFAIPIDDARETIARLLSVERLDGHAHGLVTRDVKTPKQHDLHVDAVQSGSAADLCGLKAGDVIREVAGCQIHDGTDLERSLLGLPVGKVIDVIVERGDSRRTLQYTVGVGARQSKVAASESTASTAKPPVIATATAAKGQPPIAAKKSTRQYSAEEESILARVTELFGMDLSATDARDVRLIQGRYKGGMKILQVRSGSPASRFGIRAGDILVGLDGFETLGPANLRYILRGERLKSLTTMSFQILREGSPALAGTMDLRQAVK
jgi:serine protease Do